jgi:serine/threonine-protein kinase
VNRPVPFLTQLRESGLLDPGQVDALSRLPEAADPDPHALARQVMQRGWLTRFQLTLIATGRAKELLIGPYLVLDRIGEGGMGQVYKARHRHMGRVVALKVIRKEKLRSPEAVQRFYQEVQAAAQLHHPNIVLAYDAGPAGNGHYLSMEYVEGIDLSRLVKESGPLPVSQACDYVRQAALGLEHAHECGLVHRDIKPANLLVTRAAKPGASSTTGTGAVVKILDMGLARLRTRGENEKALTQLGAVIGTPDYIAPEQALDSHAADIRADVYSLGCTLYYLLSGRPPFNGTSLTEILLKHQMEEPTPLEQLCPDLPTGLPAVLGRLMAKRPSERFQTPGEVATALECFCKAGTTSAARAPVPAPQSPSDPQSLWGTIVAEAEGDVRAAAAGSAVTDVTLGSSGKPASSGKGHGGNKASEWKRLLLFAGIGCALPLAGLILVTAVLLLQIVRGTSAPRAAETPPQVADKPPIKPPVTTAAADPRKPEPPAQPGPPAPLPEVVRQPGPFPGHSGTVTSVGFSSDGRLMVSGEDRSVRQWDAEMRRELMSFTPPTPCIDRVRYLPDDRLVASVTGSALLLLEVRGGKELCTFESAPPRSRLVLSPDARLALSHGNDETIRLWDEATGKELRRFKAINGQVHDLALASDNHHALSASAAGIAQLWDVEKDQEVRRLEGHQGPVLCVTFSADSRYALTGGGDKTVRLWDVQTGKEVGQFVGHGAAVQGVAFSPDGRRAASASRDGTVRLWDVETRKEQHHWEGHQEGMACVVFSPDGAQILAGGARGTLILWDLPK